MTISSTTVKNSYSGDSSTTTFSYTFKIFQDSDIQVIIRSSTGTETTKTITTHYTVTGAGVSAGGSVIFTSGNIPVTGETVILRRNIPQTQAIDYIANDPFPAESHEEGLDRATMAIQQIQEEVTRSIKLSKTNTMTSTEFTVGAAARANKILAFDTNGEIAVTQELGTFRGNWATATSYNGRDLVKDTSTNNIFIVNTAHTSSGSQPLTTNANSALYELIVDAASASTSATAAASSASAASTSASNASTSASAASSSASTATTQATNASNSATAAAASAASAATLLDNFDDVYLGAKASDPSVDNDGDPLTAGDLYYNTVSNVLKYYTGSAWIAVTSGGITDLVQDTTPQLGGSLDVNGNSIISTSNGNIVILPNGTGKVSLDGIFYPTADGSNGQFIKTDGSGNLSFASSGLAWQSIVTAATLTAVSGRGYWIDTTSNACTVTLPASATNGDTIILADYARTWGTNAVTINTNSLNFQGNTTPSPIYNTSRQSVTLVYSGATQGWIPTVDDNVTLETPQNYSIDFLVVAGGGSGGREAVSTGTGGGGGAGGYRTSTQTVNLGVAITVTVGDGGAITGSSGGTQGNDGSNSSISGTGLTTITSTGGGGGGGGTSSPSCSGRSGGSGGGAGNSSSSVGTGNSPSTSPSQGNNGGGGGTNFTNFGGGGGGAGEAGNTDGNASGGDGTASSITGSSVTYAGGGSGASNPLGPVAGGDGGGGTGGKDSGLVLPTSGTANTGGGGGGNPNGTSVSGGGGKGIVILSMADEYYTGTTTGSPTVTTGVSGKTILQFTGSGSYTT